METIVFTEEVFMQGLCGLAGIAVGFLIWLGIIINI